MFPFVFARSGFIIGGIDGVNLFSFFLQKWYWYWWYRRYHFLLFFPGVDLLLVGSTVSFFFFFPGLHKLFLGSPVMMGGFVDKKVSCIMFMVSSSIVFISPVHKYCLTYFVGKSTNSSFSM